MRALKRYMLIFMTVILCVCASVYIVMPDINSPDTIPVNNDKSDSGYEHTSDLNSDKKEESSSSAGSITAPPTTKNLIDIEETSGVAAGAQDDIGTTEESTTEKKISLWHPQEPITTPQKKNSAELAIVERILLTAGFEYDSEQNIFYSSVDPWQKNFGFTEVYDTLARFGSMIYETERFRFNYGGRDWMFQVWKGRYGITTGCEIGIYYKDENEDSEMYLCAEQEDFVSMDFFVYKQGEPYMFRGPEKHWWLTGFKLGEIYYAEDLYMIMTFYLGDKDEEMVDAFEAAVANAGFEKDYQESKGYVRDGQTIQIYW